MSANETTKNYVRAAEDLKQNPFQWAAYESKGHCVVLAGPGSGKTKVLTTKMARMLSEDVRRPRGIACITYSNQCAKELKQRLGKLGIEEGPNVFIGTVHSFCFRQVVVPYAQLANLNVPNPLEVATQNDQNRIFETAVESVLGNETPHFVRTPFDEFRRTVLDRTSPEWVSNERYAPLAEHYEQLLSDEGKIDFDGMMLAGLSLIENNAWARKVLKAKYPILVIDEYQDLGVPLHEIVMKLCLESGIRLFAVGDPDQSIYGFTGARPSLMAELSASEDVEDIHLRLNYRCGKTIINASTTALAESRNFESARDHEGLVYGHSCQQGFQEQVELVVERIIPEALVRREGRKLGDIGILYLNKYNGEEIAQAVEASGIEYARFDRGNPYQRTPVILWLEECAAWCASGWKSGEPRLSSLIQRWLRFMPSLSRDSETRVCRQDLVRFLFSNRSPDKSLLQWLNDFGREGLFASIKREPTMADEVELLSALHNACKQNGALAEYTVANFGGQRGSPERLNLTTIHSAKGLEYDVVIMVGMEQGLLPSYWALKNKKISEERRKFYVAMTRARHEVHLLWSGWYLSKGMVRRKGESQFVTEVMEQIAEG